MKNSHVIRVYLAGEHDRSFRGNTFLFALTEAAAEQVLYFQMSLAAGGEEETPKVLVEHKEKVAVGQVFVLWYLGKMDAPTGD